MASIAPSGKSWKEHNKIHKEQRKKRREEVLLKKVKLDEAAEATKEIAKSKKKNEEKNENNVVSTISIAIPGSILENAQSRELQSYLAGQIARAACIYKVDEIIVFDDQGEVTESEKKKIKKDDDLGEARLCCLRLARILQYLECPQYLRKYFFPIHNDLQYAGLLNPLDAPHHLRQQDESLFREGVVTNKPIKPGRGSQVNVGLLNDVHIDKTLKSGLRVTVKIPINQENSKRINGTVVSPSIPRLETGIYWGYSVRLASNLSAIFSECPYTTGYDLTIGTSDKGKNIADIREKSLKYNHGLIVFGGLSGLEAALDSDPNLNIDDPSLLFHQYLNTCPNQGSRTIRTEEAILISLSKIEEKLFAEHPALPNLQFQHSNQNSDRPSSLTELNNIPMCVVTAEHNQLYNSTDSSDDAETS